MLKGASVADWRSVQPAKTAKASAAEGWAKERFPWSEAVRMNWVKRRALEALPLKRPELRERPVGGNLKKRELVLLLLLVVVFVVDVAFLVKRHENEI